MTGFLNSAATSRITWMLSASSCFKWVKLYEVIGRLVRPCDSRFSHWFLRLTPFPNFFFQSKNSESRRQGFRKVLRAWRESCVSLTLFTRNNGVHQNVFLSPFTHSKLVKIIIFRKGSRPHIPFHPLTTFNDFRFYPLVTKTAGRVQLFSRKTLDFVTSSLNKNRLRTSQTFGRKRITSTSEGAFLLTIFPRPFRLT